MSSKTASSSERWARRQVPVGTGAQEWAKEAATKTGDYNIWYNKHQEHGQRPRWARPPEEVKRKERRRCDPERDSGRTRATGDAYICIYFAQGRCEKGPDCLFYHRVPTEEDEKKLENTKDIFGRDRFAKDRDDMGGVGTFNRENRTLYINGIVKPQGQTWQDVYDLYYREFSKFGPIQKLKVMREDITAPYIFVTYKWRASAEFAKEAMIGRDLGNGEYLNVRWATEDTNPEIMEAERILKLKRVLEAGIRTGEIVQDASGRLLTREEALQLRPDLLAAPEVGNGVSALPPPPGIAALPPPPGIASSDGTPASAAAAAVTTASVEEEEWEVDEAAYGFDEAASTEAAAEQQQHGTAQDAAATIAQRAQQMLAEQQQQRSSNRKRPRDPDNPTDEDLDAAFVADALKETGGTPIVRAGPAAQQQQLQPALLTKSQRKRLRKLEQEEIEAEQKKAAEAALAAAAEEERKASLAKALNVTGFGMHTDEKLYPNTDVSFLQRQQQQQPVQAQQQQARSLPVAGTGAIPLAQRLASITQVSASMPLTMPGAAESKPAALGLVSGYGSDDEQ